ncbi:MAG: M28 family peptidase [Gemmatimonadota bacterium]
MRLHPLVLLALFNAPLPAQAPKQLTRAAESITDTDVGRHLAVIADDSMMGRDTPSAGLEMTAAYIAAQFKKFGLKPAGENGGYFQRYPLMRRRMLTDRSTLVIAGPDGSQINLPFNSKAALVDGGAGGAEFSNEIVLVGGPLDPDSIQPEIFKDKVAVLTLDIDNLPPNIQAVAGKIASGGVKAFLIISQADPFTFATRVTRQSRPSVMRVGETGGGGPPVIEVLEKDIIEQVPAAQETVDGMRSAPAPFTNPLEGWTVTVAMRDTVTDTTSAPNVVGMVEGSDATLKSEYVVYSGHMDHIGITPGAADSINNGADDDGSGSVGVVELAEAFSQKGTRPRRSILFMTVSGEEKGLWGSAYFTAHPTVPLDHIVADLNIDMIGRNWTDTVVAIGRQQSDLGSTLDRIGAAHSELHMTPIDDIWPDERLYFRSDHFNFARKGVPVLFFTSGLHPDYHKVSDSIEKIDTEKEARILRLLFFLGSDIANTTARPQWNPKSYEEVVGK